MKKLNISILVLSLAAGGACYKAAPSNKITTPTAPTVAASPIAEKSAEPVNATGGGDYNAALDYFNAKNYDRAAAEFAAVVARDRKNQPAQFYLGKSFQALKKETEAIGAFQKAIELKPDDAAANFALGKIYFDRKDFEAALPFMQKAAKIKYTSAEYLVALGDTYRELKRCNFAMPPYGNSLGFDDKNAAAYYGMGLCYIELKNNLAAASQVRSLEKLDKNLAKKLSDQIPK